MQSGVPLANASSLVRQKNLNPRVLLTFDDGTVDHYTTVMPLLDKFGIRAIFYITTAKLDKAGYISRHQAKDMIRNGHVIGSHTHTHPRLPLMGDQRITEELEFSAEVIHQLHGERPLHFAPPGGLYHENIQRLAWKAGYRFFRTMDWGYNRNLEPMRIQVIPMTERYGELFLRIALTGKLELAFKSAFQVKKNVRRVQLLLDGLLRRMPTTS